MTFNKTTILLMIFSIAALLALQGNAQPPCTFEAAMAGSNIDIPSRLETGQRARIRVDTFNSGTCWWDTRYVRLSIQVIRKPTRAPIPLEEFKLGEMRLRNTVQPGKKHAWYYEIQAPMYAGVYELEWAMTNKGDKFDMIVRKKVEVNVP